ncbi:iron-containing redox enzyme family protein [Lysobacter sp. ESA13C]|uniref:TenA family transcriptional regulator n=1 Tax=Lysobacter sp. ESA13C TaxID=2862676 RepID=UPI001CBCF08A|nr:iron-containing redox enzyme family protein [Lysobacter sp. ESA13C]
MHVIEDIHARPDAPPALWDDLFPPGLLLELERHPFLRRCREGERALEMLRAFLVQHSYYSENFTRYLCALMSRMPSNEDVRALAMNLVEETGLDRPHAVTHAELYRRCLGEISVQPRSAPILGETTALIESMFHYCRSPDPLDGLAALCLGAEAIVPTLYGGILDGLRAAGYSNEQLHFFVLHVSEDEDHALVMRDIINRLLQDHPHRRAKVVAVGEDMIRLRMSLLDAVLARHPAVHG